MNNGCFGIRKLSVVGFEKQLIYMEHLALACEFLDIPHTLCQLACYGDLLDLPFV
jgi:hypothetical protein